MSSTRIGTSAGDVEAAAGRSYNRPIPELPIFQLPITALPGEAVPLHVFEPRYRRLVAHCLDADAEFVIALFEDETTREVGCAVRIVEVIERFEDGRSNILTRGERRIRLLGPVSHREFPVGDVGSFDDDPGPPQPTDEDVDQMRDRFRRLAEAATGEAPDPLEVDELDAFGLAARVELPTPFKQRMLESRSEAERVEMLSEALRRLLGRVGRDREVAERAQTNGSVGH